MSKVKPLAGIIKDTHLKQNNVDVVLDIFQQFIDLLKSLNIRYAIHLGDLFSERGSHNLTRLITIGGIIKMFIEAEIKLILIPGNHDKEDLADDISYLDVYQMVATSEYFELFSRHDFIDFDECKLRMHFIPYFPEGELYMEQLTECVKFINPKYKNVLCTHIAINGVRNNDGSIVDMGIPVEAFSKFTRVYVGHYHDESYIEPNICYLPGSYQQNFGETEHKGFTILNDDLTTRFYPSTFKRYKQLKVQAGDRVAMQEIVRELKKEKLADYNVRVKVLGDQAAIESMDVSELQKLGVDVKWENIVEVQVGFEDVEQVQLTSFTKGDLLKNYIAYAKEFGLTQERRNVGLGYLRQIK